jgi:hypothetical protein
VGLVSILPLLTTPSSPQNTSISRQNYPPLDMRNVADYPSRVKDR